MSSHWEVDYRDRIRAKTSIDANGCWLWQGTRNPVSGYAQTSFGGKYRAVHRVSYEAFVGPIPAGLHIDHLCRVRHCVNPAHLEPVTARTNLLRGETQTAKRAAVTHCPQGHPYDADNTYVAPKGGRACRICRRERRREWSRTRPSRAKR